MKAIDQNVTSCSGLKIIDCVIRFFKPTHTACCHMRRLIRPIGMAVGSGKAETILLKVRKSRKQFIGRIDDTIICFRDSLTFT